MPFIKLSSELTVAFTVEKKTPPYPISHSTKSLWEHCQNLTCSTDFSEHVYLFKIADVPVTALVVQHLRVRVMESMHLDAWFSPQCVT